MSENRYIAYLPDTVKELQEFQRLSSIESVFLEEEAAARDAVVGNQWILTAERNGLLRLAKIMNLSGTDIMETETLRQELLFRWSSRSPYTYFHLQDWLDGCLGEGDCLIDLQRENYLLRVILELRAMEKKEFLEKHIRKIIPANLVLQVILNTNTHRKLSILSHGQMNALGWTYGQIPYKELSAYGE